MREKEKEWRREKERTRMSHEVEEIIVVLFYFMMADISPCLNADAKAVVLSHVPFFMLSCPSSLVR